MINSDLIWHSTYFDWREKLMNRVANHLKCSERAQNNLNSLVSHYADDAANLICGDYTDDSDKCQKVLPLRPVWNRPLKYQSFVISMAEVIQKLGD